ncbi:(2Fe-2S)-binding protein [soil metagenome]
MDLTVNGQTYASEADPSDMLLWVLRDELGLTGTKFGCGIGICGSCTVHVGGSAMRSCVTSVAAAANKEVRTVEGLATVDADGNEQLHPIQQAFIDAQVPQCAWCMNGQMMTALAFLEQTPDPTQEAIVDAMGNNYCRCGCYVRIKTAVADAAEKIQVG